ncbi:MAG: hypothetical protein ACR2NM_10720 [Bythopirellula sp.]
MSAPLAVQQLVRQALKSTTNRQIKHSSFRSSRLNFTDPFPLFENGFLCLKMG